VHSLRLCRAASGSRWPSLMRVVFVRQFLLLVKTMMDKSRRLSRAVGELLLFGQCTDAEALNFWSEKAPADAKL